MKKSRKQRVAHRLSIHLLEGEESMGEDQPWRLLDSIPERNQVVLIDMFSSVEKASYD